MKKLEPQIKIMGNMQPKQKIKIIKKFMSFMTKAKKMFDEYKEISSSLTDDAIICKPILKEWKLLDFFKCKLSKKVL